MDAESAEAELSEAAKTLVDANAAFKAAYPGDHLSAGSLYAWLVAFATSLRLARAAGDVVVHFVIF